MIKLTDVTDKNRDSVAALEVKDSQRGYLDTAAGILARGEKYRDLNSKVFVICNDETVVGVALVKDFADEPYGYDLQQFLIDKRYQGQGFGYAALTLILDFLIKDGRYDHVEICVKKENMPAINLYKKCGFVDSGYVDSDVPDSVNLIYYKEIIC